jgi:hypothetical protein
MNRAAVIISNPGEPGAESYCGGVKKDVKNYRSFLLSPTGGLWGESEILEMNRPSVAEVREEVKGLSAFDYVFVVFVGHGWHSTDLDSTVIELRAGQELDSADLRLRDTKQTIALDCCRVQHPGMPEDRALREILAKAGPTIHHEDCRRYYDERIEKCSEELVVMYACSKGQRAADDDEKGGIYTYNLLESSQAWARGSSVDTSREFKILSVAAAHEQTVPLVERIRGNRQTPHIEKPRSGPYYPFCIVA